MGSMLISIATAIPEEAALAKARQFITKARPSPRFKEVAWIPKKQSRGPGTGGPTFLWYVETGQCALALSDETGEPLYYVDHGAYEEANAGMTGQDRSKIKPFYRTKADLIAEARKEVLRLGIPVGPDAVVRALPWADARSEIRKEVVYVRFYDRPYGYSAGEDGNAVIVGLDCLDGHLVELQRQEGYQYERPSRVITKPVAFKAASEIMEGLQSEEEMTGPHFSIVSPRADFLSERGSELAQSKTAVLSYVAYGPDEVVILAADTAEVLWRRSGYAAGRSERSKSGSSDLSNLARPSKTKTAQETSGSIKVASWLGPLALAMLVLGLWWGGRHKKSSIGARLP